MTRAGSERGALKPAPVSLRALPAPDRLEWTPSEDHVFLIAGDDGSLATAVAERLTREGWPVVMLGLREGASAGPTTALPDGVHSVELASLDDEEIQKVLDRIRDVHGPIQAALYLCPRQSVRDPDAVLLDGKERETVRFAFLLAKHLQPVLTEAAAEGRALFATMTRVDGALGTTGDGGVSPVVGGLSALSKTLRLEWPEVFCRAIDLAPAVEDEVAAAMLLEELYDPNRLLAEVGRGPQRRVTLEAGLAFDGLVPMEVSRG